MEYKVKKQDCKTTLIECDNGAEYCLNTFTFAVFQIRNQTLCSVLVYQTTRLV